MMQAMGPEGRDEATAVRGARLVVAEGREEGRFFGQREKAMLASAMTRIVGVGDPAEAGSMLLADMAMQNMGRQRLEDIERGVKVSSFSPRDIVASHGGVKGLDEVASRADAMAMARGAFHDLPQNLAQPAYERLVDARRGFHALGAKEVQNEIVVTPRSKASGLMAQATKALEVASSGMGSRANAARVPVEGAAVGSKGPQRAAEPDLAALGARRRDLTNVR